MKQEKERKDAQKQLKIKYHVDPEENIFVVEKSNMFKFLIRTGGNLFRLVANIIIFFLSLVGLASLIYPGSRLQLFDQAQELCFQLIRLLH